jgi:hypothetical protein
VRLEHDDRSICSIFGQALDLFGTFDFDPAEWDGETAEVEMNIDEGLISGTVYVDATYRSGPDTFTIEIDASRGLLATATSPLFGNGDCDVVPARMVFSRVGGYCE